MGSQHPSSAADAPQQELPPLVTRRAAWPYFSFTTSLMSVLIVAPCLFAKLNDLVRLNGLSPGATFREEKCQQVLKGIGIRRVSEEAALAFHGDHTFVFQFVEMVREVRRTDSEFGLNLSGNHAFRVGRQEELSDAEAWLRSNCREHVREARDVFRGWLLHDDFNISIIIEVLKSCQADHMPGAGRWVLRWSMVLALRTACSARTRIRPQRRAPLAPAGSVDARRVSA